MVYGVISLITAQILILCLTCAAYLRMRSHQDTEKHDRISWGIKVDAAVSVADSAKRQVEMIEMSHYKALLSKFEAQNLEIADMHKELLSLRNEVVNLRVRHASETRAEKRKEIREAGEASNEAILLEAQQNGHAFPVPADVKPTTVNTPRPFGRIP